MTNIPDDIMQNARHCTTDNEIASAILTERFRTIVAVIGCFINIFDQGGATGSRIREMLRENDNVVPGIDFVSLTSACANALFDFKERAILAERARCEAEKNEMLGEIKRLREALRPFAEWGKIWGVYDPQDLVLDDGDWMRIVTALEDK